MIKINDKFKAERDERRSQWILYETYIGKDKDKKPKEQVRETYHSTLRQVCNKVIDASVAGCGDAMDIIAVMDKAGWVLEGQVSGYIK